MGNSVLCECVDGAFNYYPTIRFNMCTHWNKQNPAAFA